MKKERETAGRAGNSGSEEAFISLFSEVYGPESCESVYMQYPFVDIYGGHRTIDYAFQSGEGRVAVEIDGNTWHQPDRISEDKYHDDLLKQNSMVHDGWRVFRWTSRQIERSPERVKDELVTFFGSSPRFVDIDESLPEQSGRAFSLMEHQKEALENLREMRERNETIALLYHATGSGKTVTAVSDAMAVGKPTLFIAHTKDILDQTVNTFRRLWNGVSVGKMYEGERDTEQDVICGSIQSVSKNLELFDPGRFGYIIIDECHHGTADSYRKILSYFRPEFTLGLTATPERTDGEDLLQVFRNVAHKLDLKTAVESGVLVPVRCIRVKTNIDIRNIRSNGFQYNNLDLDTMLFVPERNKLIADTYTEYCTEGERPKQTVIFCTSVRHAEEMARLLTERGIEARAVSGSCRDSARKEILRDYEERRIHVLCACDLLNEGWDSPRTEALFMARPTLSKTIYMQQLGRGMRPSEGKEFLMVFDFVDNANMFNCPYSLHRLVGAPKYREGATVLGEQGVVYDPYVLGERAELVIDYPVHAMDYEMIDLFNWHDRAREMISSHEFTRRVSVQGETIERYIREGKLEPAMTVPVSEHKRFYYFTEEQLREYAKEYHWTLITAGNMKKMFMDMVRDMTMSYSYKPVFILALLEHMDEDGTARLEDVTGDFADYYEDRAKRGLPAERKPCIFTRGGYTEKDVERLVLSMPFKRFEDMGFIAHSRSFGKLQLDRNIARNLTEEDRKEMRESCERALKKYFGE